MNRWWLFPFLYPYYTTKFVQCKHKNLKKQVVRNLLFVLSKFTIFCSTLFCYFCNLCIYFPLALCYNNLVVIPILTSEGRWNNELDYFLYNFCRSRYGFLLYLQMARQKNEKMTISLLKNLELWTPGFLVYRWWLFPFLYPYYTTKFVWCKHKNLKNRLYEICFLF